MMGSLCIVLLLCSCNHFESSLIVEKKNATQYYTDNVLNFNDVSDFVNLLTSSNDAYSARLIESARAAVNYNFVSMLDIIPSAEVLKTEEQFSAFISAYPEILVGTDYIDSNEDSVKLYNLSVSPQLASLVNPEGLISVGGIIYNVLDEEQLAELEMVCKAQTKERVLWTTYDGLTIAIPLFRGATAGSQYSVKDYKTKINGRSVVVQLWKGYCPLVLGAGGVGAEIGIYNPLPFCKNIWLPDYKHPVKMSYSLVYNKDQSTYLTLSKKTWWLNGWKVYENYPSIWGKDYTLKYTIDGDTRSW